MENQVLNLTNSLADSFIKTIFTRLENDNNSNDVTLVSRKGDSLGVHRIILTSYSKVFAKMLHCVSGNS